MKHEVLGIIVKDKNLWHDQLVKFLRDGVLPQELTKSTKKMFKLKASHYSILGYVLYYRGFYGILLRCLERVDSQISISCAHNGISGGHFSGPAIIKRLMHMGYYWPIMDHNYVEYIKKYCKYQ